MTDRLTTKLLREAAEEVFNQTSLQSHMCCTNAICYHAPNSFEATLNYHGVSDSGSLAFAPANGVPPKGFSSAWEWGDVARWQKDMYHRKRQQARVWFLLLLAESRQYKQANNSFSL